MPLLCTSMTSAIEMITPSSERNAATAMSEMRAAGGPTRAAQTPTRMRIRIASVSVTAPSRLRPPRLAERWNAPVVSTETHVPMDPTMRSTAKNAATAATAMRCGGWARRESGRGAGSRGPARSRLGRRRAARPPTGRVGAGAGRRPERRRERCASHRAPRRPAARCGGEGRSRRIGLSGRRLWLRGPGLSGPSLARCWCDPRGVRLRGRGLLRRGRLGDVLGPLVAVPPALSAGGLRIVVPAGCSHGAQPNRFDGGAGLRFRRVRRHRLVGAARARSAPRPVAGRGARGRARAPRGRSDAGRARRPAHRRDRP